MRLFGGGSSSVAGAGGNQSPRVNVERLWWGNREHEVGRVDVMWELLSRPFLN